MNTEPIETLGPYRIEAKIGSGGMGAVYRAYDSRLDRQVAIKRILSGPDERTPEAQERFLREARAPARLNHPSIVQVHDLLSDEGEDWIVMELVDGSTLADLLQGGPLPIPQVLEFGRQIADGLAHAHRQGTIHRDLKPENVMVTSEGYAKILDFGLAKQVWTGEGSHTEANLTASGAILGTCRAMSPEQARGFEIDQRSDLFSLGTLLYEMSTAIRPFEGKTPLDTLTRVCSHYPPSIDALVADVPPRLADLIDELLRKEPARRPEGAEQVARILASLSPRDTEPPNETTGRDVNLSTDLEGETRAAYTAPTVTGPVLDEFRSEETTGRTPGEMRAPLPSTAGPGRSQTIRRAGVVGLLAVATILILVRGSSPLDPQVNEPAASHQRQASAHELYSRGQDLLTTFYRPRDLEAAILAFEQVLDRDPESAAAYAGLSRAFWRRYYAENRDPLWLERALSHGRKAVELGPFLTDARVSVALALSYLGRLDEAEAEIQGALALDPANADIHRTQAEFHRSRGQLEKAEHAVRAALDARGDDFDLHDLLGSILAKTGRLEEAADCFQRSIELAPESIVAYRNLAGVYYQQNRFDEAAKWMQKALEIRPDSRLYASLGILYFDQGLYRQATSVFEQAVESPGGGNDYRVWENLADSYRWTPGHDNQARDAYERAITLLRETGLHDLETRSRLALFLVKRGDTAEAREELEAITGMEAEGPTIPYRIAVAWELLGNRAKGLEALGKALAAGYPLPSVRRNPELTELRADAGFHRLLSNLKDS